MGKSSSAREKEALPSTSALVALVRAVTDEPPAVQEALLDLFEGADAGRDLLRRARQLRTPSAENELLSLNDVWLTLDAEEKLDKLLDHPTFARADEPFAWQVLLGFAPGDDGLYGLLAEVAARKDALLPPDAKERPRLAAVRRHIDREWELERYADRRLQLERTDR